MHKLLLAVVLAVLSSVANATEWVVTQNTEVKVFSFDLNAESKFCTVRKGGVLYSTQHAEQVLSYARKGKPEPGDCGPKERYLVVFPEDLRHFTVPKSGT